MSWGVTGRPLSAAAALTVYVAAIVAANVLTNRIGLVPAGFGLMVTAGTFAAGFALLARDVVQEAAGLPAVLAGIGIGVLLSWQLASPSLATASGVAFLLAELSDLLVYSRLRSSGFIRAAFASNAAGAVIDTFVFLWLAGFPVTASIVTGQLVAKLLWATLLPLIVYGYVSRRRAVLR